MTVNIEGFGKITASKEVLIAIGHDYLELANIYRERGYEGLDRRCRNVSSAIYKTLTDKN